MVTVIAAPRCAFAKVFGCRISSKCTLELEKAIAVGGLWPFCFFVCLFVCLFFPFQEPRQQYNITVHVVNYFSRQTVRLSRSRSNDVWFICRLEYFIRNCHNLRHHYGHRWDCVGDMFLYGKVSTTFLCKELC